MNQVIKKSISVLMAFLMILSLFAGIYIPADAATVDYQYGSTGSYPNVIKNWGTRGEPATFLSPNAEAFYSESFYDEMVILDASALYIALYELMSDTHTTITDYDKITDVFQYTDCQNNGMQSTSSSGFYSGIALPAQWDGGLTWNREHTWPQSNSAKGDDIEDIMSIRPESNLVNSSRGNKAYGQSSGFYNPNIGDYDLRGDVARVILYTYVRWGAESQTIKDKLWVSNTTTDGVFESESVLLTWMAADPVDTWEMGRNDSVQSITGTRNVFVDYPELAFVLFDEEIPDMDTPSGNADEFGYTVTASSNNDTFGTVSVNHNHISAIPNAGYRVAGYEVVSGNPVVTRNGDVFTVRAEQNCAIRILFELTPKWTAKFLQDGKQVSLQTAEEGCLVKLPEYDGDLPDGYTFRGWVKSDISDTATMPAEIYPVGTEYILQSNTSFYALVSWLNKEDTSGGELTYKLVTDQDQHSAGKSVVIAAAGYDKAMGAQSSNSNNRTAVDVIKTADSLVFAADAGVQVLTLESGTIDGTYAFYTGSGYLYAASSNSNLLKTKATLDVNGSFGVTVNSDGSCVITAMGNYSRNNMMFNTQNTIFSCYSATSTSTQIKPVALYIGEKGGTTYYTTAWGCKHINETPVDTAPTCTEQGYTTLYCADCGQELYVEDYVAALGHSYQSVVTAPTFTTQGYTTHTCTACGDSYVDSYTTVTDVAGWSLTLGSDLSVNFKISVDDSIRETAKVCISVAGAAKTYEVSELTADADGAYLISVKLAAAQMTDEIAVQLINGSDQSEKKTYSVRAYADSILAGKYSEATKTLVTQMLHYGAAAQNYFNYHTERLANAGLEAPGQVTPTTDKAAAYTGTVDGVAYSGATMLFRDKIAVRFYFQVTGDIGDYTFTVNGNSCTPVKKGDSYYIEAANINPQDLNTEITVQVSGLTVSYSPMNYLVNMNRKGTAGLQTLVQALYAYHLAAQAYLSA